MTPSPSKLSSAKIPLGLVSVGILNAAVYLATLAFYFKGPESHTRTAKQIFACLSVIALLFLFWAGYRLINQTCHSVSLRKIAGFAAVFAFIAFLTYPFHSTDVFGYINRGWQQVHYGQNPYVYVVADISQWRDDPMLRENWIYTPSPYGFLFMLLARLLCRIGNGNFLLTLFLFKVVNLSAYATTAWLVWSGAKRLNQPKPMVALYSFLWNPLVLMHHLANGHNDILCGFFTVLAVYLMIADNFLWIIPALVAAALVKHGPLLLIPLALIFIVRNRSWKTAVLSCVLGILLFTSVSAPYLRDWQLFRWADIQGDIGLIDNSLQSFLIHIYESFARLFSGLAAYHAPVSTLIKVVLRSCFLIFVAIHWVRIPREFTAKSFAKKSLLILCALIFVASPKINGWYLGMILPLALVLDEEDWLRRLVVLISCSELLSLTFFKQAYIINYLVMVIAPVWIVFRQELKRRRFSSLMMDAPPAAELGKS